MTSVLRRLHPVPLVHRALLLALAVSALPVALVAAEPDPKSAAKKLQLSDELRQRCLDILREGMAGDEFWPAMHAAEGLTLGGHGAEVRAALPERLKTDRDDQHRCGLARELVRAGDKQYAQIMLDILAGENPYGHVHAAESMYKVGVLGDRKLLRAAAAQTDNVLLRLMAAGALAKAGEESAFPVLRQGVELPDTAHARTAAWLLGRVGDASDIPRLRARQQQLTDPLDIAYFDHSLAALQDPAGLAALQRNLSSPDPVIRTYAATFAGDARCLGCRDGLVKLLADKHLDARLRAAQSLLVLSR